MIASREEKNVCSQADEAWKIAIEDFFPEIMAFCFPEIYSKIEWRRGWEFLDKEFQTIVPGNENGTCFVDKLVKVYLLNGNEQRLMLHIEVQGQHERAFPKRMFVYNYRVFDQSGEHPISCAILTDESRSWRPSTYQYKFGNFEVFFKFYTLKLLDLESQLELLEQSKNPIAAIILIQLKVIRSKKKSSSDKYLLKLSETKRLYKKFDKETLRKIFSFIDFLISLPENLMIKYRNEICKFEEENNMRPMNTFEQYGFEKGIKQGKQEIAISLLRQGQPMNVVSDITGLQIAELNVLTDQIKLK